MRTRLLVAVFGVVAAACSASVGTVEVSASGDGTVLYVGFASCNADLSVEVHEAAGAVSISATRARDPRRLLGGDDCLDGREIRLEAPIGDRAVVDATTGEVMEVVYAPWNQAEYGTDDYRAALEEAAACFTVADPDIGVEIHESGGVPWLDVTLPDVPDGGSYSVPDCMKLVEPLTR